VHPNLFERRVPQRVLCAWISFRRSSARVALGTGCITRSSLAPVRAVLKIASRWTTKMPLSPWIVRVCLTWRDMMFSPTYSQTLKMYQFAEQAFIETYIHSLLLSAGCLPFTVCLLLIDPQALWVQPLPTASLPQATFVRPATQAKNSLAFSFSLRKSMIVLPHCCKTRFALRQKAQVGLNALPIPRISSAIAKTPNNQSCAPHQHACHSTRRSTRSISGA